MALSSQLCHQSFTELQQRWGGCTSRTLSTQTIVFVRSMLDAIDSALLRGSGPQSSVFCLRSAAPSPRARRSASHAASVGGAYVTGHIGSGWCSRHQTAEQQG